MKRLILSCGCLLIVWAMAGVALAQGGNTKAPHVDSAAVPSGAGFVRAGQWAQFQATVTNPTDQARDLTLVNSLGRSHNVQFGRSFWMPPQSRRVVRSLARLDESESVDARKGLDTQTMLLPGSADGSERTWLSRQAGKAIIEANSTISILGQAGDGAYDIVEAMRKEGVGGKGVRSMRREALPQDVESWQLLDMVVIAGPASLDPLEMQSLRAWVLSGGRLWVMLDQVDESFMAALLGDDWPLASAGQAELSRVVFGRTKQAGDAYDLPVRMARVIAPTSPMDKPVTVHHRVGDWPALLSFDAGAGKVVATTLEARAWLTPQARRPVGDIADLMMRRRPVMDQLPAASAAMAAQSVGRQIVSRTVVMTTLGVMTLAILVLGVILHRQGRLEWMGLIGPAIAAVAAIALLGIGKTRQGQVPLTVASMQLVNIHPGQLQADSVGSVAVYSPATNAGPLQARSGGMLWPDMTGLEGKVVRFLQTDIGQWQWQNVEFNSGAIRAGSFEKQVVLSQPIRAVGRFGPDGLDLRVDFARLGLPMDPLVLSAGGVIAPQAQGADPSPQGEEELSPAHRYLAGGSMELDRGQYVRAAGSVVSDQQQRRQQFFKQAFKQGSLPDQPTFMAWTDRLGTGLALPGEFESRDSALLAVPIEFEPSPAGSRVTIPAVFMPFNLVKVPGDQAAAVIYNPADGSWISPLTDSIRLGVSFDVPVSVLPLAADRAELVLRIRAPGRTVEVFPIADAKGKAVASVAGPSGVARLDVSAALKKLTPQSPRIGLVVQVGGTGDDPGWSISGVSLELSGQVQPAR